MKFPTLFSIFPILSALTLDEDLEMDQLLPISPVLIPPIQFTMNGLMVPSDNENYDPVDEECFDIVANCEAKRACREFPLKRRQNFCAKTCGFCSPQRAISAGEANDLDKLQEIEKVLDEEFAEQNEVKN